MHEAWNDKTEKNSFFFITTHNQKDLLFNRISLAILIYYKMSLIQNPFSHNCTLNITYLLLSLTITPLCAKANNTLNHVMHGLEWRTGLFRTITLKSSWKSINTASFLHWCIAYNERSSMALNVTTMPTFLHCSTKIISSHPVPFFAFSWSMRGLQA